MASVAAWSLKSFKSTEMSRGPIRTSELLELELKEEVVEERTFAGFCLY